MKESCENCRFSIDYGQPEKDVGMHQLRCLKNAPFTAGGMAYGLWPSVTRDQWCGQWEERGSCGRVSRGSGPQTGASYIPRKERGDDE